MASIRATPYLSEARIIRLASSALEAKGFSHRTCFPRDMHRILCSAWQEFGVAI